MKPAPFTYHAPDNLAQAIELLSTLEGDVRLTAGGQSLLPMMNLRVVRPDHLIDIGRTAGLAGVTREEGLLTIGATTTHRTIEKSELVKEVLPLLAEMATNIGHIPIRERGTIGGSVSLADPTAEFPLACVMLDARMSVESVRGNRVILAEDFFEGALQTNLAEDEILTAISFPVSGIPSGYAFTEFSRRKGDFCMVGAAVLLGMSEEKCEQIRIGLCGVDERPFISAAAYELAGKSVDGAAIHELAEAVSNEIEPMEDGRATIEDRRTITRALVERTLLIARDRALGNIWGGSI